MPKSKSPITDSMFAPTTGPLSTTYIPPGAHTDSTDIDEMFDLLLQYIHPGKFLNVIKDMYSFYQERGYLTSAQYDVCETAYFKSLREEHE